MRRIRVIPVLLMQNNGLYKTVKFANANYLGDPINAVKIFNEKEVDELLLLDIGVCRSKSKPDFKKIEIIAGEAFMPMGYGGGVSSVEEIKRIIFSGFEKVIIGTAAYSNPSLVGEGSRLVGSQSIVVSIDYRNNLFGKPKVYGLSGKENTGMSPIDMAKKMEDSGAGELILHSIERDGTYTGYDLDLITKISESVSIPIVACGGASEAKDFVNAVRAGASAVAAGSVFVYHGHHKAVLISYPSQDRLKADLHEKI